MHGSDYLQIPGSVRGIGRYWSLLDIIHNLVFNRLAVKMRLYEGEKDDHRWC